MEQIKGYTITEYRDELGLGTIRIHCNSMDDGIDLKHCTVEVDILQAINVGPSWGFNREGLMDDYLKNPSKY